MKKPQFVRIACAVLVCGLSMSAPVRAQTTPQTEAQLLAQIDRQPAQLVNYLDLARLYIDQRRLEDAHAILARATALIRQAQAAVSVSSGQPFRLGGDLREPSRIVDVPPAYPPGLAASTIQGTVIVEAVIGKDGTVKEARIIRSVPMLDQAALDAVRQWRYTPTLLNGVPVPVVFTTTVKFPPDPPSVGEAPIRVGGDVKEPMLLKKVNPIYPDDAQQAHWQGVVILEAVITKAGSVKDVRVLRSVLPSMDQAAVDAVRQWVYTPTLLNGVPVEIVFTVTVSFTLK